MEFSESYRRELEKAASVLDSIADNNESLNLGCFYALQKIYQDLDEFLNGEKIDPSERTIQTLTANMALGTFCRSVDQALKTGTDPEKILDAIDNGHGIYSMCNLLAEAIRRDLKEDEQRLKKAA